MRVHVREDLVLVDEVRRGRIVADDVLRDASKSGRMRKRGLLHYELLTSARLIHERRPVRLVVVRINHGSAPEVSTHRTHLGSTRHAVRRGCVQLLLQLGRDHGRERRISRQRLIRTIHEHPCRGCGLLLTRCGSVKVAI